MWKASGSEGSNLPRSDDTIVWRETPSLSASCAWDQPRLGPAAFGSPRDGRRDTQVGVSGGAASLRTRRNEMFTNRELASLILMGLAIVGMLIWPSMRPVLLHGISNFLRCLHWKVLAVFLVLFAWIAGYLALGWLVGLWNWDLLKDTVIITLTFAIPMTFRIVNAQTGGAILRRMVIDTLSFAAFLTFYLNVEPFPLMVEVLIQAFTTLLVLVAANSGEGTPVRKFATGLLAIVGIGAIVWTTVAIVNDWGLLVWPALLRSFLLTVWLPALLLPLFYVEAFLMTLEGVLPRLRLSTTDRKRYPKRVSLAVLLGLHFRVKLAARFNASYYGLADPQTYREARQFMRKFRADVCLQDAAERERVENLRVNMGKKGTDVDGAQLDRREFHVTKDRLDWISTTQMGRFEGNGGRYWDDNDGLTDLMVAAKKHELPEQHGFVVQTSLDGQKWRAWRVLPSAWVLGMGGSGWRSEWVYAGDEPPQSWPGDRDPLWVDKMSSPDLPPDWEKSDEPVLPASAAI
jgi:hypothetical protein